MIFGEKNNYICIYEKIIDAAFHCTYTLCVRS